MKFIELTLLSALLFPLPLTYAEATEPIDEDEILQSEIERRLDSMFHHSSLAYIPKFRQTLSESDFEEVAKELDVEVAAIKAVVEIEAGKQGRGITDSGTPIINFDLSLFQKRLSRLGFNTAKLAKKYPEVFSRPDVRKYKNYNDAQHVRFEAAKNINEKAAIESTFWGMFQIGGFNWNKCGVESCEKFVELMSRSERDQLELFAHFLQKNDMVKYMKNKNWTEFARRYNGPKYRSRGYHNKLAAAYKKYKS